MRRIRLPDEIKVDVANFSIKTWFDKKKDKRKELLESFPQSCRLLEAIDSDVTTEALESIEYDILENVARMIAQCVKFEGSLLDYLISNKKTTSLDQEKLNNVCYAAGWVIIQTYYRELGREGGNGSN